MKRTHYDIDKYPVHVRKRIAAERAKDRELYNPYKVEPLREDENDQFVKSHFDSKQSAYAELNDSEYHFDDSSIQQEVTFGDVGLHFKYNFSFFFFFFSFFFFFLFSFLFLFLILVLVFSSQFLLPITGSSTF